MVYEKQKNRWGYLNNPEWANPSRPFTRGGQDDYDGRESEEPQLWTPPKQRRLSHTAVMRHHQCGHWHLKTGAVPSEEFTYDVWHSCPEAILPSPTSNNEIWFISTTDEEPTDTFYIIRYDGVNYYWTEIYSYSIPISASSEHWAEPDISVAQKGSTSVVVLIGQLASVNGGYPYAEVFTFSGNDLVQRTVIPVYPTYGRIIYETFMGAKFCMIDSANNIHVVLKTYVSAGDNRIYDFISSDNGATFNPVLVRSGMTALYYDYRYVGQFSDGSLYIWADQYHHKSINNGASWTNLTNTSGFTNMMYANDTFFAIRYTVSPYNDLYLRRSTDGTTWANVLTVVGNFKGLCGADIYYDGTYYYLSLLYRNNIYGLKSDGYSYIYRSSDGISWTLMATLVDTAYVAVPSRVAVSVARLWASQIIKSGNTLFYMFYYDSESAAAHGSANVYLMAVWKSTDNGVTWEVVYTPFYDVTRPGAEVPSGPWEE